MMPSENGNYEVDIEMDEMGSAADLVDVDFQPMKKKKEIVDLPFKGRFKSILMENYDKELWWVMVEDQIKKDGDFAAKVRGSSVFLHTQCYGWLNNIDTHTHCRL